jgi:hypothetical protein
VTIRAFFVSAMRDCRTLRNGNLAAEIRSVAPL